MSIHIHAPGSFVWRLIRRCPRCKAETDHLVRSYLRYGPIVTCCECGAYRNDGVLRRRRKRDAAVARQARIMWATAGDVEDYRKWLQTQFVEEFGASQ